MANEASSPGSAVIDAVKRQMQGEARTYRFNKDMEVSSMSTAQACRDEAAAAEERFEQCERFLNLNAPGWGDFLDDDERKKYALHEVKEEPTDQEIERAARGPHT